MSAQSHSTGRRTSCAAPNPRPRPSGITLTPQQSGELENRVEAAYPLEACGLLLGLRHGDSARVTRVTEGRNLRGADGRERFELDPAHLLWAYEQTENGDEQILGVWHSHPDRPAKPSAADLQGADAAWSTLILSVSIEGAQAMRSWRLHGGRFVPERLRVESNGDSRPMRSASSKRRP